MSGKHEPHMGENERLVYLIAAAAILMLLMYVTAALLPS